MTKWEEIYNKYPTKLHPTAEEAETFPVAFFQWFVANDQGERVRFAKFHDRCVWNVDPNQPWIDFHNNKPVSREAILELIPNINEVADFDIYTRTATYNNKDICWNPGLQTWKYQNNRTVHFNKTPTKGTNSKKGDLESDEETAQVNKLLGRAKTALTEATQKLTSLPGTPSSKDTPLPKESTIPRESQLPTTEIHQVPTPPVSEGKQPAPIPPTRTKASSSSS